jgi:uncharacterized protein
MQHPHFIDEIIEKTRTSAEFTEAAREEFIATLQRIKETRVNVLITGVTGGGKSSTINALFNADKAKVGQGVDPQTMDIECYEFDNLVLFDSPGLGDGKEADLRHAKNITEKLLERDAHGEAVIDLVLVVLDAGSRDLGTSFELINKVVIPALGEDTSRLVVALNQADMAMKGRGWDGVHNRPLPELEAFLNEKVASTRRRIKEATGVDVEPVFYSAGYKEGDAAQQPPYNLSKLLLCLLRATKREKRVVFKQDVNPDQTMWRDDDGLHDYRDEVKKTWIDSMRAGAERGGQIGESVGRMLGGELGARIGHTVGAIGGAIGGLLGLW